eukprot:16250-Pelagococcus_subviridis.AAC.1
MPQGNNKRVVGFAEPLPHVSGGVNAHAHGGAPGISPRGVGIPGVPHAGPFDASHARPWGAMPLAQNIPLHPPAPAPNSSLARNLGANAQAWTDAMNFGKSAPASDSESDREMESLTRINLRDSDYTHNTDVSAHGAWPLPGVPAATTTTTRAGPAAVAAGGKSPRSHLRHHARTATTVSTQPMNPHFPAPIVDKTSRSMHQALSPALVNAARMVMTHQQAAFAAQLAELHRIVAAQAELVKRRDAGEGRQGSGSGDPQSGSGSGLSAEEGQGSGLASGGES